MPPRTELDAPEQRYTQLCRSCRKERKPDQDSKNCVGKIASNRAFFIAAACLVKIAVKIA